MLAIQFSPYKPAMPSPQSASSSFGPMRQAVPSPHGSDSFTLRWAAEKPPAYSDMELWGNLFEKYGVDERRWPTIRPEFLPECIQKDPMGPELCARLLRHVQDGMDLYKRGKYKDTIAHLLNPKVPPKLGLRLKTTRPVLAELMVAESELSDNDARQGLYDRIYRMNHRVADKGRNYLNSDLESVDHVLREFHDRLSPDDVVGSLEASFTFNNSDVRPYGIVHPVLIKAHYPVEPRIQKAINRHNAITCLEEWLHAAQSYLGLPLSKDGMRMFEEFNRSAGIKSSAHLDEVNAAIENERPKKEVEALLGQTIPRYAATDLWDAPEQVYRSSRDFFTAIDAAYGTKTMKNREQRDRIREMLAEAGNGFLIQEIDMYRYFVEQGMSFPASFEKAWERDIFKLAV